MFTCNYVIRSPSHVLKPNKACLISCYFISINEITTRRQFNRQTASQHSRSFDRSDNATLCYENYSLCSLSPKLLSWKLTLSLHTPASLSLSLSLSLYLFSLVDFSLFPALPLPVPDNFPQMAHQKRFIERKYRQELKEMRRERERQEKETDEPEECRKWQHLFGRPIRDPLVHIKELWLRMWRTSRRESAKIDDATSWSWSCDSLAMITDCLLS